MFVSIKYGYELVSCHSSHIRTPLSDRCYRALFSAFHMHLHCAMVGYSGSGKTEILKGLANQLALKLVLHYCVAGVALTTVEQVYSLCVLKLG